MTALADTCPNSGALAATSFPASTIRPLHRFDRHFRICGREPPLQSRKLSTHFGRGLSSQGYRVIYPPGWPTIGGQFGFEGNDFLHETGCNLTVLVEHIVLFADIACQVVESFRHLV